MIRAMIISAMLAGLACSGCTAQERIDGIDTGVMRGVVQFLGHEITREVILDNGTPVVEARVPGGFNYTLAGMACDPVSCAGMVSLVEFPDEFGMTAELANQINGHWAAVKTVLHEGTVEFSRYDVTDGGTTTEALAASVNALLDVTRTIMDSLLDQESQR